MDKHTNTSHTSGRGWVLVHPDNKIDTKHRSASARSY